MPFDLQEQVLSDLQFIDQHTQEADRRNVPADVICVAAREVASDSGDEQASVATTDSALIKRSHWKDLHHLL